MNRFSLHHGFLLTLFTCLSLLGSYAQQWQKVSPVGYDYYSSASFISDNEGWIFARYGEWPDIHTDLIHTMDGAVTFQPVFALPDDYDVWYFQMVDSINGYSIVETPDVNYFWKTTDGGFSWIDITDTVLFNPGGPMFGRCFFYFLNKDNGFIGGYKSIYKTSDGGLGWTMMNTPSFIDSTYSDQYLINKIYFCDNNYGWAACCNSPQI